MAKYSVHHTCGHDIEHQLVGPTKERDRRLSWLGAQSCLECDRTAKAQQAARIAQDAGLPALTGSEKQIAWAETIRTKYIETMSGVFDAITAAHSDKSEAARLELADALALLRGEMIDRTAARSWIDERDTSPERRALMAQITSRSLAPTLAAEIEEGVRRRTEAVRQMKAAAETYIVTHDDIDTDAEDRVTAIRAEGVTLTIAYAPAANVMMVAAHGVTVRTTDREPSLARLVTAARALVASKAA